MYLLLKRFFDFIISVILLMIAFPVISFTFIILLIVNKGNPLFFQKRPGKAGKAFYIIKFKTMDDKKNSKGDFLPDAQRLHPIGQLIRKTSIDELPQLINVLKGDMSLVGPRPLLMEYLPLYNEEQARRHDVRPGITGWAQVNGRNVISWEEKFKFDVWYVNNISFVLDMKILWMTIIKVFQFDGVSQKGHVGSKKFTGN